MSNIPTKTLKDIANEFPALAGGPLLSYQAKQALKVVGENIKIARLRRNDTESDASKRLGISRSTWRKLEKGDASVSLGVFVEAMVIYGFVEQLFNFANPDLDEHGKMLESLDRRKRSRG